MTTLKELKKAYPDAITCSGKIYTIDGIGKFYQRDKGFGLETYVENNGSWKSISFAEVASYTERIFGEKELRNI